MKFLLLLTVAFGLAAGPALADPVSAIASVFTAIGAGAATAVALAQITIGIAFNLLVTAIQKRKMGKRGVDTKFEIELGDDTPLTFALGKSATAGKRKFIGSWGQNNRYITEVIEYSALPQGLAGLWVGDEIGQIHWDQIDTDGTDYDLGHPLENKKDDGYRIWLRVYDGTQTAACPLLVGVFGDDPDYPWTEDHVGKGKSYVVITTRYDSDTLTQYPQYLIEPAPLPLYDPRKDSTAGGLGPHRWGNRSTYEPSENPAVIAYNIARGIYFGDEWLWGGKNLPAWRLPFDEWVAAMNACDALVGLSAGGTEPAYRAGCEVSVDMEPLSVMEEIGRGANMRFAEVGGRLKPLVDLPASSVFSVTDEDIVITEGQSFRPFAPISEVYNALSATYPEPREKWASKDAPEYVDTDGMAADGGRYLPTGLTYSVVPYADQVQRLMRAQMREYRRERVHQFSLPPEAYALEPLDVITYTSDRNGYENKRFIVENITKLPAMRVQVTLREVDPSDYDWQPDYELGYTITPPAPVVPFVQGITDFGAAAVVVSDGAGRGRRVAIQITCAAGEVGITEVRVQIRKLGGDVEFDLTRPYDAPYQWHITDVVPATTYQVRGQLISALTGSRAWSGWVTVTTSDLRISQADLDAELVADLSELHDWIDEGRIDFLTQTAEELTERAIALEGAAEQSAERWRQHRDQIRALLGEVVELAARDHAAREEIRQSLTVQLGEMGARFADAITVLAGSEGAAVIRLTELEALATDLSARITQANIARVDGDNALSALISALAVGTAAQFDHTTIWYWDTNVEGWTGTSAPSVVAGWLRPAAGSDVISPASLAVDGAAYQQIRARVRRVGAPVWQGFIWWAAVGQSWDISRRIAVAEPTWTSDEAQITANMLWSGSIDRIRLELVSGSTGSAYVELDWLAIGRPAPGASSAELLSERSARIAADEAMALDMVAIEARLTDAEGELDGQAGAVSSLNSRVGVVEGGLLATAGQVTALDAAINDPATGLNGLANAIDALEIVARDGDGSQEYQSTAIRALKSAVKALAAEAMEGAFAGHLRDQMIREYVATASQSLGTRIDLTNDEVKIVAEALTRLQAAIPGLATADALQALTSTVAAHGGLISSQSDAITALNSAITNPTTGLPSKLNASALNSYATKTYADGVAQDAAATATTALQASLEGSGGSIKAAQDAAQAASDLAGSKGKVLVQSTAPATVDRLPQNLWIDTTGGANTPKRWNGSAWVAVTDKVATDAAAAAASALAQVATKLDASVITNYYTKTQTDSVASSAAAAATTALKASLEGSGGSIKAAQDAAQAASDLAGSKGKVLVQSTAPAAADRLAQNLWIDTTGGANTPKRWNGSAWVAVTDKVATDAAAAAASALAQVATKADATALSSLASTVSGQGSTITALSTALQSLGAVTPAGVAQALMKMEAQSGGSGVLARIGLKALAGNSSDATRAAALFLEALSDGKSRIIMEADQVFMLVNGNRVPLFVADGDGLRIHSSLLKIYGDMVVAGTITAAAIQDESVTVPARVRQASPVDLTSSETLVTLAELTLLRKGKPTELSANFTLAAIPSGQGFMYFDVIRDHTTIVASWTQATHPSGYEQQITVVGIDLTTGTGSTTYSLRARKIPPEFNPGTDNADLRIRNRYLSATSFIR